MIQIFGTNKSKDSRAAERFFKERRLQYHFVDLGKKPMSKGEIGRFIQKFGLNALLDLQGKRYEALGLAHMRVSDESMLQKIEAHPDLLRLPLVRGKKTLAVGNDAAAWKAIAEEAN